MQIRERSYCASGSRRNTKCDAGFEIIQFIRSISSKPNPYRLRFSAVRLYFSQAYSYHGKEQKVGSKVHLIIWGTNVRKETNECSSKISAHTLTLLCKALLFVTRNKPEQLCYFVIKDWLLTRFLQILHPWQLPCVPQSVTHSPGSPYRYEQQRRPQNRQDLLRRFSS